jgi:DNA-binding GntR family transcriptional regulator
MNDSPLDPKSAQVTGTGVLDRSTPEPLYQQIKGWMQREMDSGRWPVHYKLPAEEVLSRNLGVNRGTLRQAIQELIAERRLTQIHGKGTFVLSSQQIEGPLADHLNAFSEELMLQHIPFRTEVLEQQEFVPEPRVTALLNLAPGETLFYLRRRRFVNDAPIILTHNYVRLDLCPGIDQEDFTEQRLLSCLERKYRLHLSWARRTFEARAADAEQSQWLALPVGAPLMYIEQIIYLEDGRPIECSDIWIPGDRFRLSSITARGGKQTVTNSWRRGDPAPRETAMTNGFRV